MEAALPCTRVRKLCRPHETAATQISTAASACPATAMLRPTASVATTTFRPSIVWPKKVWAAEHHPSSVGFSHARVYVVGARRVIVSRISRVYSVDLVTRPGSTSGLFESENPESEPPPLIHAEIMRPAPATDVKTRDWESPWREVVGKPRKRRSNKRTTMNHFFGGEDDYERNFGSAGN